MNKEIDKTLSKSKSVAIIGHINPDGDCFGSISGVYDYIVDKFKCLIHCFAECNTVAEEFEPFIENLPFNPNLLEKYDTCICVDTADLGRLGKYADIFNNSKNTICIDHHATNTGFADINIITNASSNCENIYYLLKDNGYKAKTSTLGKLCAGMLTDTNNLSTNSVTEQTYLAFAEMKKAGVDVYNIRQFFFSGNTLVQYKLLALAMNSAKFYNNNTIMVMKITKSQMKKIGATADDFSPIINQAFRMKHALCAILITPRNNQTHVSFRAKQGIDVSIIAQHFGGGGHKPAAAFTVPTFTEKNLQYILENLTLQINSLPKHNKKLF